MRLVPFLLALLAACTQYPANCDRRALQELRTVNRLIEETRRNLARGYAYELEDYGYRAGLVVCTGGEGVRFCTGNDVRPRRRPVAIDPAAEQRKLDLLRERRERLSAAAVSCRPL